MKLTLSTILSTVLAIGTMEACTGIKLRTQDKQAVHGRTLEFGLEIDTSILFVPQGYSFTATTPLGKGMVYEAKYACIGTMCFNQPLLMDGLNEKGLSVGTFYFSDFAKYTPTTSENQLMSLSPLDFPNWILTQFKDLDEVKENLAHVFIAPTAEQSWGSTPPPFHYIVYDKMGDSLVIEPINGKLKVYDNPLGTFTNSPAFDWHMTNLRHFLNLRPTNVSPLKIGDFELSPMGQGSGLVGLPGDFTPVSRFVRAALFSVTAEPPKNVQEAIFQTFHILNQFDIPVGIAREAIKEGFYHSDYTQATVVHDPINLMYYFRTYNNQNIQAIDLKSFNKESNHLLTISTKGQQSYQDISKELKPFR